jgi:DNA mismatch repair protein MutS
MTLVAQSSPPEGTRQPPTNEFRSILFDECGVDTSIRESPPEFFIDLNLDQVVEAVTAGREEYNLKPFFYTPLDHVESVEYRHDVFRDLEKPAVFGYIRSFAQEMRNMRSYLAQEQKLYYPREKQAWFLDAVDIYCGAVDRLANELAGADLSSRGFLAFRDYLARYIVSETFASLHADTRRLKADLSAIQYCLHIEGLCITASKYESQTDYSAEVLRTFEKFKQGSPKQYGFNFPSYADMNHVEAAIADLLAGLYPEIFTSLEDYHKRHRAYLDSTIAAFDREVQFYSACLEYMDRLKQAGLAFSYPRVSAESKEICSRDTFDLALANRLVQNNSTVITNEFYLCNPERIIVVSGPNQGGKTTFARAFGQLHYLASLGCPVPGTEAKLFLCDHLFTHFEREEDIHNLSGKLEDDLLRVHRVLELATSNSILIMNESFLSTTLNDALFLSRQIMQQIVELDMICVSVTFLDELASFAATTVSMVSTIDPADPTVRTFKVVRKPADGLAYAAAIAEKYGLTYDRVQNRIAGNAKGRAPA